MGLAVSNTPPLGAGKFIETKLGVESINTQGQSRKLKRSVETGEIQLHSLDANLQSNETTGKPG